MKRKKNDAKFETMAEVLNEMYDYVDDDEPGIGEKISEEPGLKDGKDYTGPDEYEEYMKGVMYAVYNKLRTVLGSDDYEQIRVIFKALPSFISRTWSLSGAQDYISDKKSRGGALDKKDFLRGLDVYINRFGR